jgi:hypothetical protein
MSVRAYSIRATAAVDWDANWWILSQIVAGGARGFCRLWERGKGFII